jgi:hypothetical protein
MFITFAGPSRAGPQARRQHATHGTAPEALAIYFRAAGAHDYAKFPNKVWKLEKMCDVVGAARSFESSMTRHGFNRDLRLQATLRHAVCAGIRQTAATSLGTSGVFSGQRRQRIIYLTCVQGIAGNSPSQCAKDQRGVITGSTRRSRRNVSAIQTSTERTA